MNGPTRHAFRVCTAPPSGTELCGECVARTLHLQNKPPASPLRLLLPSDRERRIPEEEGEVLAALRNITLQDSVGAPQRAASNTDLCPECAARISQLQSRPLVSPLHHLLSDTKRHIPSVEEELHVRVVIQDAEERMAEIDATRARISRLLDELAQERVKIQEYTDLHRVMVAPVWNLPPEILSGIFISCLPHRLRYPHDITRASIRPSLLLASVNQHWRNVALSTPQLWTVMYIDEQRFGEKECMPQMFLSRSGDLPLSLYVRAKEYPCRSVFTDFISSLSRRWHHITLDIEIGNLAPLFSSKDGPADPLPVLRTLDLRMSSLWFDGIELNPFIYFINAPRLEQVSVTNQFSATFSVLPQWRQLRVWDSPVPLADFPLIFEWAPKLEQCFLQPTRLAFGQSLPPPDPCCSAVHTHLTSLHISTGLITNVSVQLHHLPHFPALRRLFIYLDKHVLLPSAETTLVPLFARSGALLEHLTLALNISNATLRACLAHTPSVTTLQIHRIATDLVLGFLSAAPSETTAYILPKLKTLRLSGKIYFTAQAVINVINARWAGSTAASDSETSGGKNAAKGELIPTVPCHPRSLKSVYILPPRHDKFESRTRKELLSFKDRGFDVKICQFDRGEFIRHVLV